MIRFAVMPSAFLILACVAAHADSLPLASVRYFNAYQNPTNWDGWSSAIYQGGGASVRNYAGKTPVDDVGGVRTIVLDAVNPPRRLLECAVQGQRQSVEYAPRRHKRGTPTYAAMIASVDDSMGRVMKTLDDLKLADNTVLMPDKTKELHARLVAWRKEVNAPMPTNNDGAAVPNTAKKKAKGKGKEKAE